MTRLSRLIAWFLSRRTADRVSDAWLAQQRASDGKRGWTDGPRWRLPKERGR